MRAPLSPEVEKYLRSCYPDADYDVVADLAYPSIRTPEPVDFPGAEFRPERVTRVIKSLMMLRHTQGKWAGQPLQPDAWQVAFVLAPIFGWCAHNEDGKLVRIIRKVIIDVPRKNGKTTLASGLALYLAFADKEPGAQVLAVAGSLNQAGNAYRPAKIIAQHSPEFAAAGIRALQTQIVGKDGSFFKAVASAGDLIHGSNPNGAVVDELHVHKSPDVLEAVESGMSAREQPLTIIITTADAGGVETVYAQQRNMLESVANGTLDMPEFYGCVWAADPDDPIDDPVTWAKANPGYGISVSPAFMRKAAAEAKENPVNYASFQRLHLGLRTKQVTKFLEMERWNRNAGVVNEADLQGRDAYGGLDLASTSDLTALTWVFPDPAGGYDALFRVFAPEGAVAALDKRTHGMASAWVREGYLTVTPGDVVDYDYVKTQILSDLKAFSAKELAYDRWNSSQLVNDLTAEGAPMVEFGQGFASMNAPLKELARLIGEGTEENPLLRHGGNPLVRWTVDNLAVETDAAGNVKPSKKHSGDKIDPVVALIMAIARATQRVPTRKSAYESRGLIIV